MDEKSAQPSNSESETLSAGIRVSAAVIGFLLLGTAALLLFEPPTKIVPTESNAVGLEPTVVVTGDFQTAAIFAAAIGVVFLMLGVFNLRPVGFKWGDKEIIFRPKIEVDGRKSLDSQEIVESIQSSIKEVGGTQREDVASWLDAIENMPYLPPSDLEQPDSVIESVLHYPSDVHGVSPTSGSKDEDPGLEANQEEESPEIKAGATSSPEESQKAVQDAMSRDIRIQQGASYLWHSLFPWVREEVERWALNNPDDISADPKSRLVGARRLGQGSGNFAWKIDIAADNGDIITLRLTQGKGGRRAKRME